MIDRDRFFSRVRANPFGGLLKQSQVDGLNSLLDAWEKGTNTDPRHLAYALATTKWETMHTMQPVEEVGHGAGHPYGVPDPVTGKTYYGRGYVQLTWKANYLRLSPYVGADLVAFPELALRPAIAAEILFRGMEEGLFTGVGLPRYFNATTNDPLNARRIINGTDRAAEIAAIHEAFHAALIP